MMLRLKSPHGNVTDTIEGNGVGRGGSVGTSMGGTKAFVGVADVDVGVPTGATGGDNKTGTTVGTGTGIDVGK